LWLLLLLPPLLVGCNCSAVAIVGTAVIYEFLKVDYFFLVTNCIGWENVKTDRDIPIKTIEVPDAAAAAAAERVASYFAVAAVAVLAASVAVDVADSVQLP